MLSKKWVADSQLFNTADTVASEAASIKSAYASVSNPGVAMARVDRMYSPELLRAEAAECRRGAIGKSTRVERTLLLAKRLESQATVLEARESADRVPRQETMRNLAKSLLDR